MPELPQLPPIAESPISVVLLALNPTDPVEVVVSGWEKFLQSHDGEILVVDGIGLPADRVMALYGVCGRLRLVKPQKAGEGAALRAGLEAATKPLVFYTLCEEQYRPEFLTAFFARTCKLEEGDEVREIDHVHMMTAFRAGKKMPMVLRAVGWLWRALCWVLVSYAPPPRPGQLGIRRYLGGILTRTFFGVRQRDVMCPFRLMRREILTRIPLQSTSAFAHVELLAKANFLGPGCVVAEEIPIDVQPPAYRGDAGAIFHDAQVVFNNPEFLPNTKEEVASVSA